jgi:hypothetical protein
MWEDWYKGVLCELIKRWGRKCDVLNEELNARAKDVDDVYRQEGAPNFAGQAELDSFLELLSTLEAGLTKPENTLTQASTDLLTDYIADLRFELVPSA